MKNDGCPLPNKPDNGDYKVSDCVEGDSSSKCQMKPGTIVSQNVVLTYWCNPGFVLPVDIKRTFCNNGTWDPEPPHCLKLCEGLHSYSLDLECSYRGSKVDCGLQSRPGTEVKTKCKDTYHINDYSSSFITTQCLPDGSWANKLYKCVPDCGIRNRVNVLTSFTGTKARIPEYPWHAGIYGSDGKNTFYKCGGTIIHPKAVLTAAHCVYIETTMSPIDTKEIQVAVGKYWSNWNHKDDSETEQKFRVIQIIIPYRYRGRSGIYEQDIAILDLDRLITLKPAVMPICFDKGNNFHLDQRLNAVGTVVGSDGTDATVDEELRVARFPILGIHDCLKKVMNSPFITYDKFCALVSNGTSVQERGSGSGMTFPMLTDGFEQNFIYGIGNSKSADIFVLTNVTVHMEWIKRVLAGIEQSLNKLKFIPA